MRYKVYDEEDKKERTLEECVTPLEVGSVRRVQVKKGDTREVHHFYQQEAETKEKEWGWKKDPYIYPRSFYSPVGYTPWDPWGRRL